MLWFYRLLAAALVLAGTYQANAIIGPDKIGATSIEMGSAGTTDTTIARTGAGTISVEGTNVVLGTIGTSGATIPLLSTANTWTLDQTVPAEAYAVGWNGSNEVPTKNDVYDKIESIVVGGTVSDADYGDITVSSSGAVWDIDSDAVISGSTPLITVTGTSAGAAGPVFKLWHDSASPAAADVVSSIVVHGGADDEEIGAINYVLVDGATTTEDGFWELRADVAGSATTSLNASVGNSGAIATGKGGLNAFGPSSTAFPSLGTAGTDTGKQPVVTPDNSLMVIAPTNPTIWLESTGDTEGILIAWDSADNDLRIFYENGGTNPGYSPVGFHELDDGQHTAMTLYTNAADTVGPRIITISDSASPAADDYISQYLALAEDSAGAETKYGTFAVLIKDTTNGSEDGAFVFYPTVAGDNAAWTVGSNTPHFTIGSSILVGSTSVAETTFQASSVTPAFQLLGTSASTTSLSIARHDGTASAPGGIRLAKSRGAVGVYTAVQAGDGLGAINFEGADGTDFARAAVVSATVDAGVTVGAGDVGGRLSLFTSADGTESPTERLRIDSTAATNILFLGADAGAAGPTLKCQHDSASPAASDITCSIQAVAGSDDETIGRIEYRLLDGATTTEDGVWDVYTDIAGTDVRQLAVGSPGGVVAGSATAPLGRGSLLIADSAPVSTDGGRLALGEDTDTGTDVLTVTAPASITTTADCALENDANFIPDSCVGDGSDASDERLKTNFVAAGDVGPMLDKIKVYNFEWNADAPKVADMVRKGNHGFGVKAQELYKVNPELVHVGGEDPTKDPWTWKPEKLVPYLLVEIQDLRKRIADLEEKAK